MLAIPATHAATQGSAHFISFAQVVAIIAIPSAQASQGIQLTLNL